MNFLHVVYHYIIALVKLSLSSSKKSDIFHQMNEKQKQPLDIAGSLIGTPYKYAALPETMPNFLDCSSFTQHIYKQLGVDILRSSIAQASVGNEIEDRKDLTIGDLIFFRSTKGHYNDEWFPGRNICIGHVAMFIGGDTVIHASGKNGKVAEENLDSVMTYEGPIVMIKRVI